MLPSDDYRAIFISASGEAPGLFAVAFVVDQVGRPKKTLNMHILDGGELTMPANTEYAISPSVKNQERQLCTSSYLYIVCTVFWTCQNQGICQKQETFQNRLKSLVLSNFQNLPVTLALKIIWQVGRRPSLAGSLLLTAFSTVPLMLGARPDVLFLFAGRAASLAAFTVLYIYTPEVRLYVSAPRLAETGG